MEKDKKTIFSKSTIVGLISILALVAIGFYTSRADLVNVKPADDEDTTENSSTTPKVIVTNTASTTPSTPVVPKLLPKPTIAVSPFTVYFGFATEIGTSSPAIMDMEVGEVVVGYEWEALPESQMFASVVIPTFDDSTRGMRRIYTVLSYDEKEGAYSFVGRHVSGEEVDFPREGLVGSTKFKVTGIDPALRICPGDRSFVWDLRFTFDGRLGVIRTPITEKLPAGKTCIMSNN